MTYLLWKVTEFDEKKVMGQAGILDSARFSYFIAKELDVSTEDIFAMVLGGHGDSMVPLPRYTTVSGIPLPELLPKEKIDALIERTRKGGGEIVKLLKTGSAYYAPANAATQMIESILLDKKRVLPCSAKLNGEYGIDDVYIGVPVKLGKNGVEQIIELKLTTDELDALKKSAEIYKQHIQLALEETGIK
jgi:malate dehydrogenase